MASLAIFVEFDQTVSEITEVSEMEQGMCLKECIISSIHDSWLNQFVTIGPRNRARSMFSSEIKCSPEDIFTGRLRSYL